MGGERASTTRRRERGEICCNCKNFITAPYPPGYKPGPRTGERYCDRCKVPEFIHCWMRYEEVLGSWRVDVTRDGRPVRSLTFASDHKVSDMAKRGRGVRNSEDRNMLELGIRNKRGSLPIYLTPEEFEKLKKR